MRDARLCQWAANGLTQEEENCVRNRVLRHANRSATVIVTAACAFLSLLVPPSSAADLPEQQIVNRANGSRWVTEGDGTGNGNNIATTRRGHGNYTSVTWKFIDVAGSRYWMIKNYKSGKCAQPRGGAVELAVVQLQPCDTDNPDQQWRLVNDPATTSADHRNSDYPRADNAGVTIRPRSNENLAIALQEPGHNEWTRLWLLRAEAATDRLWQIKPYQF
jgi:Ricin-type beta-trefoil lectin domain-like